MNRNPAKWISGLRPALASGWAWLRHLSGDDAYERYLDHLAQAHPTVAPLTRVVFESHRQQLKWNRISRCC